MKKAAFYDLDGTLLSCNLVTMHAYYARNDRSIVKSMYQLSKVILSVPLLFGLDLYSRSLFNVFSFRAYRGMHRDRLVGLADDLFEVTLKPSIFPGAGALLECTRELGYRNVLVTGTLDFTIRPIAMHFDFDEVICNRLEFRNHVATGRVLPPLLAENEKARSIREYAAINGIDLAQSCAFSDSSADVPMLSAVGHPVATNPTRRLRRKVVHFLAMESRPGRIRVRRAPGARRHGRDFGRRGIPQLHPAADGRNRVRGQGSAGDDPRSLSGTEPADRAGAPEEESFGPATLLLRGADFAALAGGGGSHWRRKRGAGEAQGCGRRSGRALVRH
jgi:HAD superfamily hydrolase (TIGR01490 family)